MVKLTTAIDPKASPTQITIMQETDYESCMKRYSEHVQKRQTKTMQEASTNKEGLMDTIILVDNFSFSVDFFSEVLNFFSIQ